MSAVCVVVCIVFPNKVWADPPHISGSARTGAIRIDGELSESDWRLAEVRDEFQERLPNPAATPPVRTAFRLLYDHDAIYVAVESFLLPDEVPRGLDLTRDSTRIWEDDAISIKIDPLRDNRTTLGFVLNAAGTQLDYMAVDNGATLRVEHDMIWESAVRVLADRWVVEVRIPLVALSLTSARDEIGLNINRDHNARAATYDWSLNRPEFGAFSALHYGTASIESHASGVPSSFTLYSLGEYLSSADASSLRLPGASAVSGGALRGIAGADARIRIARDTWAEATLLTDFSQVDLDDALVNLDRFPLFFPERRPFFINGLDIFEGGVAQRLQPFYSRRIGLAQDGSQLSILGGAKVYGREGPISFGVLDVLTDEGVGNPATNDLAARTRVTLDGRSSYIGATVTSRTPFRWDGTAQGGNHLTFAIDSRIRADNERLELYALAAATARDNRLWLTDDTTGEGVAGAATVRYRGEVAQPQLTLTVAGPGFEPDLGFNRRPESARANISLPFVARPGGAIRRLQLWFGGELQSNAAFNQNLYTSGSVDIEGEFFDGWVIGGGADYIEDTVVSDFEITPNVLARRGRWRGANLDLWLSTSASRNPILTLYYGVSNAYFGGTLHNPYAHLRANVGPHFRLDVETDIYYVMLREYAPFWTGAVNALFRVTPDTAFQFDLLGRIDLDRERSTGMFRMRWRYQPGSDLFFVWRENIVWTGGVLAVERIVTFKIALRFDQLL